MTTVKSLRDLTILAQGARLRASALAGSRDPNEAYLMAHRVMAGAFDDAGRGSSREALDRDMNREIVRGATARTIGHEVMP
jgi:hypothetical protein